MNKVHLLGNLCRDNELRFSTENNAILRNSLAVRRNYKNKKGEYDTDFVNILFFGKRAEFVNEYTKKGSKILVHGSLQTRTYEVNGEKKYMTEVLVEEVEFVQPLEKKETKKELETEVIESKEDAFKDFGDNVQLDDLELTDEDLPF